MEGGSRFLTYMVKALMEIHLPLRQVPEESVLDGGIGYFGYHEYETHDNSY